MTGASVTKWWLECSSQLSPRLSSAGPVARSGLDIPGWPVLPSSPGFQADERFDWLSQHLDFQPNSPAGHLAFEVIQSRVIMGSSWDMEGVILYFLEIYWDVSLLYRDIKIMNWTVPNRDHDTSAVQCSEQSRLVCVLSSYFLPRAASVVARVFLNLELNTSRGAEQVLWRLESSQAAGLAAHWETGNWTEGFQVIIIVWSPLSDLLPIHQSPQQDESNV